MEMIGVNTLERGPAAFWQDQRYLWGGPEAMDLEEVDSYIAQVGKWRKIVRDQGRHLITVAVLGGMALAHRPGVSCRVLEPEVNNRFTPIQETPSALDLAGQDILCDAHPRRHPVFLLLNYSCPIDTTWASIGNPVTVERLMLLEPDLILLAPELHRWGVPLSVTSDGELAAEWRQGLRHTVRILRAAQNKPPHVIMRGIPNILVLLPMQGQF